MKENIKKSIGKIRVTRLSVILHQMNDFFAENKTCLDLEEIQSLSTISRYLLWDGCTMSLPGPMGMHNELDGMGSIYKTLLFSC